MVTVHSCVEDVRKDLEDFIASGQIDEEKVENYKKHIEFAHQKKMEWALSERFEPINSIRVYGAYRLIYDSIMGGQFQLKEAKKRGENPITAERLAPYFSQLVVYTKLLEAELTKDKEIRFGLIERYTRELTTNAESQGLIYRKNGANKEIYDKIQSTVFETIKL
ncbi:MAG: hypothetical protein WC861_05570 [Candidatus Micrarchaeia archaeon]|jgi:hypothetical protein